MRISCKLAVTAPYSQPTLEAFSIQATRSCTCLPPHRVRWHQCEYSAYVIGFTSVCMTLLPLHQSSSFALPKATNCYQLSDYCKLHT